MISDIMEGYPLTQADVAAESTWNTYELETAEVLRDNLRELDIDLLYNMNPGQVIDRQMMGRIHNLIGQLNNIKTDYQYLLYSESIPIEEVPDSD